MFYAFIEAHEKRARSGLEKMDLALQQSPLEPMAIGMAQRFGILLGLLSDMKTYLHLKQEWLPEALGAIELLRREACPPAT